MLSRAVVAFCKFRPHIIYAELRLIVQSKPIRIATVSLAVLIWLAAPKTQAQNVALRNPAEQSVSNTKVDPPVPFRRHLVVHPGPENMLQLQIPSGFTLVIEHVSFSSPVTTQMPLPEIKLSDTNGTTRYFIPVHFAGFDANSGTQKWVASIDVDIVLEPGQRPAVLGDFSTSSATITESFEISGHLLPTTVATRGVAKRNRDVASQQHP
jgi:hypothetical protein